MPRPARTRRESARRDDVPASVHDCLAAVNAASPPRLEWTLKLEMLRQSREAEWKGFPQNPDKLAVMHAVVNPMSMHRQILDNLSSDPPGFEEAAIWLLGSGRTQDLYRCEVCGRWELAAHDRRVTCAAPSCQHASNRKRQQAYRARLRAD